MDTIMEIKEEDPLSDDIASQNVKLFFTKNAAMESSSDIEPVNDVCFVAIKTEIESETPLSYFCVQKEGECFTKDSINQVRCETVTCSNNCGLDTKTELGSQNEREFLPEDPAMRVKKYNKDDEMGNQREIKEEPWLLETDTSPMYDDIMMSTTRGKYGVKYDESDMKGALSKILNFGWSVYKSSKEFNIPYNTLKDRLKITPDPSEMPVVKKGRPFFLSGEKEAQLVSYVIEMQKLGFGLTATEVRKYAFRLASEHGKNPFGSDDERAGWDWWRSFKKRHGLCMRLPENISYNRAAAATRENLNSFYDVLEMVLNDTGLRDKPNCIWNLDESGFTMVPKPTKIESPKGSKRVQTQATAEKGQTTTVLLAVNALGQWVPPLFVFKGMRMTDNLRDDAPALSQVSVSKNGWINSELFFNFMQHLVEHIPPARPVMLMMDSHSSHVSPEAWQYGKKNGIIFLAFPSHCTQLLQPLDVSVFGPLKKCFYGNLQGHLKKCGCKPTRNDFFPLFKAAMKEAVTAKNIMSGFSDSGIYPFNRNAITNDALKVSAVHEIAVASVDPPNTSAPGPSNAPQEEPQLPPILPLPTPIRSWRKRKNAASSARVFGHDLEVERPSTSGTWKRTRKKTNCVKSSCDENTCATCSRRYENDANGEAWIQCLECKKWFHENFLCHSCTKH